MKYIDAEKLKEDIQANLAAISFNDDYQKGYEACGMSVLKSINSLQQEQDCIVINKKDWEAQEQFKKNKDFGKPLKEEQPKKSKKNCNGCPHCIDRKDQYGWHFKGCFGGPYKGKFIAEIDECPLEQEHSEMDLDELINDFLLNNSEFLIKSDSKAVVQKLAHHFYELGKLKARKEE